MRPALSPYTGSLLTDPAALRGGVQVIPARDESGRWGLALVDASDGRVHVDVNDVEQLIGRMTGVAIEIRLRPHNLETETTADARP
ncbi:MAG: hypothetical protein JWL97_4232 [Gemmatimonadales bacterium]|nr:hypothetical protein [Gemmatimonadales bacterium]